MTTKLVDLADLQGVCIRATPTVSDFLSSLDDVQFALLLRLARRARPTDEGTAAFMYRTMYRRVIIEYEAKRIVDDPASKRPKYRKYVTLVAVHNDARSLLHGKKSSLIRWLPLLATLIRGCAKLWTWVLHAMR